MLDASASRELVVCPERAPSKPPPSPLQLAQLHQVQIRKLQTLAEAEIGCIKQLLIGRYVRHSITKTLYLVLEVRMLGVFGVGFFAVLYGRARGRKRGVTRIGSVYDVEIVNTGG